ncbi:hypothetical protein MTR67_012637 [Solanum verrucosum]|uniref:Uncharacterized protein n=1 Tax=Solanum verrucosum TaxID=315347 RepID=A0AAF0TG61_SOLVR|nr:hypothetical protein MTR67_012637 [Solanum verrucosum]
MVLECWSHPR